MSEEWEATRKRLIMIEEEPNNSPGSGAAMPSYDMMVNAVFARALRLIMEKVRSI